MSLTSSSGKGASPRGRRPSRGELEDEVAALRRLIADSSGLALVSFDVNGRIVYFGEGAERIFGFPAGEVVGTARHDLLHEGGDFEAFCRLFHNAESNATAEEGDLFARTRGRGLIPVQVTVLRWNGGPQGPHVIALYRDQSLYLKSTQEVEALQKRIEMTRRHTEKEAEFLRVLLSHTIDTIRIGLAVQDLPTGMIAYTNEAFERISGYTRLEMMGHTLEELLADHPRARTLLCGYVDRIRASVGTENEWPPPEHWDLELRTGAKTVEVYGRPIVLEEHENQFLLLIVEDRTERERLQTKLVQSEKLAAVGQLAAGIAHEIRNPLNTIYNALFDLKEITHNPTPEMQEDISISMEEIRRVQDIINNLLDFARDSDRSIGVSNLGEVVKKTIRLVRHDLGNKGIRVDCDLESLPPVGMNSNALKQILINLVTNAAQAMSHGGRLWIRARPAAGMVPLGEEDSPKEADRGEASGQLRLGPDASGRTRKPHGEHVLLEISDTGAGIAADKLPNIFNPFFTTKEPGMGTGLGLSVVHSLVREAGGAISVETTAGEGTTFRIRIPAVANEE